MKAKAKMKPVEVKKHMAYLQTKLRDTLKREKKIGKQIEVLRNKCPHKNVHQKDGSDCMEMKTRTYCRDCGLDARDFKTS